MPTSEQLPVPESKTERRPERDAAAYLPLDHDAADSVVGQRKTMFSEIEARLSPLMRKALSMKLDAERETFGSLLAEAGKRAEAERRRQGILDTKLFRKRRLVNAAPARRSSARTSASRTDL